MGAAAFTARIRFEESEHAADSPLSDDVGRVLTNNLLHYADEAGQVRASWRGVGSGVTYSGARYITHKALSAAAEEDAYHFLWASDAFAPVLKSDGTPYPMRVSLSGYSELGDSVTFRIVYAAAIPGIHADHARTGGALTSDYTSVSTTDAELTGSKTIIAPSATDAGISVVEIDTIEALSGASVGITTPLMMVSAWALTTNYQSTARLTGVSAAEYVGL